MSLLDILWSDYTIDIQMWTNYHTLFNEYDFDLDPDHLILLEWGDLRGDLRVFLL